MKAVKTAISKVFGSGSSDPSSAGQSDVKASLQPPGHVFDTLGVLGGTKDVVGGVKMGLESRGWVLLSVVNEVERTGLRVLELSELFFEREQEYKDDHQLVGRFGYVDGPGKRQGYRMLTGGMVSDKDVPEELEEIRALSDALDGICRKLTGVLCDTASVFGKDAAKLGEDQGLPLLTDPKSGYGMLDVVQYASDAESKGRGFHVPEHVDPGLFALSICSTAAGLELYDPVSDSWMEPPRDVFILWCGSAAYNGTKGSVKPAVHRVRARDDVPVRRTLWYEVCSTTQIPSSMRDGLKRLPKGAPAPAPAETKAAETKAAETKAAETSPDGGGGLDLGGIGCPPKLDADASDMGRGIRVQSGASTPLWFPDVDPKKWTVDKLLNRVEWELGIPLRKIVIHLGLRTGGDKPTNLDGDRLLSDYGVKAGDCLHTYHQDEFSRFMPK